MKKMRPEELAEMFQREFHSPAEIFSAPGRVNLIGEHTDYNEGYVLPSAIGFYSYVAVSPRNDGKLILRSSEFSEACHIDLDPWPPKKIGTWCDYVLGVAVEVARVAGRVRGANLLVHGEVPLGAGLSSSAALEVASALAFLSLQGTDVPLKTVARLCQRAENEFVGARVGIMDQFVSCHGEVGHAVLLDCRSLDYELVPIPDRVKFVIANTMVKHELAAGEYNLRRQQCEQGVEILSRRSPEVRALRDVSPGQLAEEADRLPALIYKRCLHVVREDERVLDAAERFRSGDLREVGRLMGESHASLRDLYEVSSPELDIMVAEAEGLPGFIGGRMTGGGFGGCTVNLVESGQAESFAAALRERYRQKTGISPDMYICSAAHGAGAQLRKAEV